MIELDEPLIYRFITRSFRVVCRVPRGFKSDLATIPRFLWPVLPPDGDYQEAAVVHDFLYKQTEVPYWICDSMFRHVMQISGVRLWKRLLLFWGVRLGRWRQR
jgi:hypothetical protein